MVRSLSLSLSPFLLVYSPVADGIALLPVPCAHSDLMVLISTLGGVSLFGAIGIILGPLIGALFSSVWYIYQEAFLEFLDPDEIEWSGLHGGEEEGLYAPLVEDEPQHVEESAAVVHPMGERSAPSWVGAAWGAPPAAQQEQPDQLARAGEASTNVKQTCEC